MMKRKGLTLLSDLSIYTLNVDTVIPENLVLNCFSFLLSSNKHLKFQTHNRNNNIHI